MLIFDIESDGLLYELTKIHCLHIYDTDLDEIFRYDNEHVIDGVKHLENGKGICGHNIINFDIPAIKKVFPSFKCPDNVFDTYVMARLLWSNIYLKDMTRRDFPKNLTGSHSLKAYGYRLGVLKDDYQGGWEKWSQEMSDYCVQDVKVTVKLYERILSKKYSQDAADLEHKVAFILQRQEQFGFKFDVKKGTELYAYLCQKREDLKLNLQSLFEPWFVPVGTVFTPKSDNKHFGYRKGCPLTKIKLIEFNPSSRQQIADRFIKKYNWKPKEYTEKGSPKIDETVLNSLPFPEAKQLAEYFLIIKRIGMLAEGSEDKAWLNCVKEDGRIHGSVNTLGAVSRRMTHSYPNVAQTPASSAPYGHECRSLFTVDEGHVLVGCDASGLELRCLAHYMGKWDNGAYVKEILEGDIHTANQKAAGLPSRPKAKRFIYAFLYGAGDVLLGEIKTEGDGKKYSINKLRTIGKDLRKKFMYNLPALNDLVNAVQTKVKRDGYLLSIDKQKLHVRSAHSALNLLFQSAGAIIMKRGLIILDNDLQAEGLTPQVDYEFVANVHDEWQIEVFNPELADMIGGAAVNAIVQAGEYYQFRCPLDGEYKVGKSWAETH